MSSFFENLERIVGNANIALGPASVGENTFAVCPGTPAEVSEVVRLCWQEDASMIPMGAGVKAAPTEGISLPCVFIDLKRLKHVTNLDEVSQVVHVQAGMRGQDLELLLQRRGLSLGDYSPLALESTIGGLLSVRTAGKSTRRHGFFEDAVLGLSAVLPTGRSIHTRIAPRRATGPDLPRALCGSEGTLGIITSAVLRIHKRPEARFLCAHKLPRMADAIDAVRLLLREEAQPSAMRLYSSSGLKHHFRKLEVGDLLNSMGDEEVVLLAATAGPTDLAACDRDLIASAATAEGGEELPKKFAETWWQWRHQRGSGTDTRPAEPPLQLCVAPKSQVDVYEAVRDAARTFQSQANAYLSKFDHDGAIVCFWLEHGHPGQSAEIDTQDVLLAMEQAGVSAGGYPIGIAEPSFDSYFAALKLELDPKGLMNPGIRMDSEAPHPRPESVEEALF